MFNNFELQYSLTYLLNNMKSGSPMAYGSYELKYITTNVTVHLTKYLCGVF